MVLFCDIFICCVVLDSLSRSSRLIMVVRRLFYIFISSLMRAVNFLD